ncbi:BTAD domain-containing putative transcriptional regulator [Nonomuraea jabiensis]|uniref:BTAD domain-containing putative transcriptional regulator n=1 Tax=Nonomuraea jabiensis TaxID=882448 RepID=UPI003D70CB07
MTASWAEAESARLEEERLTTLEDHVDLRMTAGDHHAVVPRPSGTACHAHQARHSHRTPR